MDKLASYRQTIESVLTEYSVKSRVGAAHQITGTIIGITQFFKYATNGTIGDNLPEDIPDLKLLTWCYACQRHLPRDR